MRRALKRGRVATILLVGTAGYLLGNWHVLSSRSADPSPGLSPAQSVALRFPEVQAVAAAADTVSGATSAVSPTNPTSPTRAMVLGGAQLALLSPEPMVGRVVAQPEPHVAVAPAPATAAPQPRADTEIKSPPAMQRRSELKSLTESAVRHANRPGFVLNDAQIASIKGRLHLTPDQERMWPSVEAALRSIAYAKARDANQRGAAAVVASLDPDSAEVQDLKSAAFPLILSFSDEQKNEVRSLAHVMGLDRLASEF
ncbi:MAG: hypothetical protein ABSB37_00480 [Xanthobacteraceae bacterium]|jgi:hypothetical protein